MEETRGKWDGRLSPRYETPLLQAAALMPNSGKHPLPVRRDGRIVVIISREGTVRALLRRERA